MDNNLQARIGYLGDLNSILLKVFENYDVGRYISYSVILMGYEDFNLIVKTTNGKFLVKIFSSFRDRKDCERYMHVLKAARNAGISQPEIYEFTQGNLYEITIEKEPIRLCVMQYIDGQTLFESQAPLSGKEVTFLIKEATKINKIHLEPVPFYDSWAISNFLKSWEERAKYLSVDDQQLISPLVQPFRELDLQSLPHCFVHGDLIKTNIMRDKNDKLYILDFSVANYYPRIQELAVLLCDILFDEKNLGLYERVYNQALGEYQKYISLEKAEAETMPLYAQVAHAMHLLCATYEKKVNNKQTKENEYFINLGRKGLKFTSKYFNAS